jgi:uncharacterized membrane protein YkoI
MVVHSHSTTGENPMIHTRWPLLCIAALLSFAFAPPVRAQATVRDSKLPEPVRKTFRAQFPKGQIEKLDVEEENGVTVYDLEFKDGTTEKETDITADGTMLEFTVVIDAAAVPAPAMQAIRKGAGRAALKRIERIEISHETKDGKTIKLPRPVTHYAVEMEKGDQSAEIVVAPDGKVLEEPKWEKAKDETAQKKTAK